MKIQAEGKGEEIEPIKRYNCERCFGEFTEQSSLKRHQKKCAKNLSLLEKIRSLEVEVSTLRAEQKKDQQTIDDLRSQLSKKEDNQQVITLSAISRPTTSFRNTTKNMVVQNLLHLKEEEMKEHTPFLTMEHIKEGAEGYAKFAMERPFKDRVACTDISRKKLAWKNDTGEIMFDSEGQQLSEKFFRIMRERNERLCKEIIKELGERVGEAWKRDDHEEADAIANLTEQIQTWRRDAFQAKEIAPISEKNFQRLYAR